MYNPSKVVTPPKFVQVLVWNAQRTIITKRYITYIFFHCHPFFYLKFTIKNIIHPFFPFFTSGQFMLFQQQKNKYDSNSCFASSIESAILLKMTFFILWHFYSHGVFDLTIVILNRLVSPFSCVVSSLQNRIVTSRLLEWLKICSEIVFNILPLSIVNDQQNDWLWLP